MPRPARSTIAPGPLPIGVARSPHRRIRIRRPLWVRPLRVRHRLPLRGGLAVLGVIGIGAAGGTLRAEESPPGATPSGGAVRVVVFDRVPIRFAPDAEDHAEGAEENGRIFRGRVSLPELDGPHRVTALVTLEPIPKDDLSVHDPWDRAGNVTLRLPGAPELELVKFMTAYGGRTEHEADLTHLASLLRGEREIAAFVDTWVDPAWLISLVIGYEPDEDADPATWAAPVFFQGSYNAEDTPNGVEVALEVPEGLERVVLRYFTSGHCTDGRDEDEFVSKANVISVDGVVVRRFHPWRDDCREFRAINPYTKRWSDGTWSSDFSRSGWCPGRSVPPEEIDLTDHLGPGPHRLGFRVENVRPKSGSDHFGYWRLSGHLVGWDHLPDLWRN